MAPKNVFKDNFNPAGLQRVNIRSLRNQAKITELQEQIPDGAGVDKHVVRWNGTSALQNSAVSIDDIGNLIPDIDNAQGVGSVAKNFISVDTKLVRSSTGIDLIASAGDITARPGTTGNIFLYDQDGGVIGSLGVTGVLVGGTHANLGYASGVGGAVTQLTSKATTVVLNKPCGEITMFNSALGAGVTVSFTLTNSKILIHDLLILNYSGGTAGAYVLNPRSAGGSAIIDVTNITAGPLSEAIVIGFAVFKSVIS